MDAEEDIGGDNSGSIKKWNANIVIELEHSPIKLIAKSRLFLLLMLYHVCLQRWLVRYRYIFKVSQTKNTNKRRRKNIIEAFIMFSGYWRIRTFFFDPNGHTSKRLRAARQLADFRFSIFDFRFSIFDFRFQISDFRFQISDFRLQSQSKILREMVVR